MKHTTPQNHSTFRLIMILVLMALRIASAVLAVSGFVITFCATNEELSTSEIYIYGTIGMVLILQWIFLWDEFPIWIDYFRHSKGYWDKRRQPTVSAKVQQVLKERREEEAAQNELDESWVKTDETSGTEQVLKQLRS